MAILVTKQNLPVLWPWQWWHFFSAFLPYGAIGCMLGAVMLAHIYAVSMETALITAVILIILILLYYGFQPGDSFWLVLTPMAFLLKIPFAGATSGRDCPEAFLP